MSDTTTAQQAEPKAPEAYKQELEAKFKDAKELEMTVPPAGKFVADLVITGVGYFASDRLTSVPREVGIDLLVRCKGPRVATDDDIRRIKGESAKAADPSSPAKEDPQPKKPAKDAKVIVA